MKKMLISVLALLGMVACTNENEPEIINENGDPVEIQLTSGVTATTRAIIEQAGTFEAQVVASSETNNYSTPLWASSGGGNVNIANGDVTFETTQHYPIDGTAVYMKAFAPRATVTNGVATFTITGEEDILFTKTEINGSKSDYDGKALTFDHLLTQLQIQVKAKDAAAIAAWGTITSIKVKQAETSLDLTIKDGTLAANATSAKKDLSLFGTTANQELTTDAKDAGKIMVLPSTTAYTLIITTSEHTSATEVTITPATTLEGKIHKVILTFNAVDVAATSTVNEWGTDGTEGTGEVK